MFFNIINILIFVVLLPISGRKGSRIINLFGDYLTIIMQVMHNGNGEWILKKTNRAFLMPATEKGSSTALRRNRK